MDTTGFSLPVGAAILAVLAAFAYVLLPLVQPSRQRRGRLADNLARQRAALYRQILELEFDFRTGKLAEADFREQSAGLLAEAAHLLERAEDPDRNLDRLLEEEIAAARARLAGHAEQAAIPLGREP